MSQEKSCTSCLVKLALVQAQLDRMELMMSAMKPTLNFKEACRYTGLSSSQLYKLVQGDEVPYAKPTGKLIFFDKAELDHWMCNKLEIEGKE